MNYTTKELVRSFDYTDYHQDRTLYKKEVINGRTYYKEGTHTATTVVGNLYKVTCPSDESFNYVLLIGVARQHPCDVKITFAEGLETAALNAQLNPIASIKFANKIEWETFKPLAETYISSFTKQFIKTRQEILNEGKCPQKYIR